MRAHIENRINESINVKRDCLALSDKVSQAVELIVNALSDGKKVLVAGNGGSAADAQHFAAELVGRFMKERRALPSIALTTDSSKISAVGNDYGFQTIFSRQVEALGNSGDILIVISTSGNSSNILAAIDQAKVKGMSVVGLSGREGGKMKDLCSVNILIPSSNTPRIQEAHITLLHIICELVEDKMFGDV